MDEDSFFIGSTKTITIFSRLEQSIEMMKIPLTFCEFYGAFMKVLVIFNRIRGTLHSLRNVIFWTGTD